MARTVGCGRSEAVDSVGENAGLVAPGARAVRRRRADQVRSVENIDAGEGPTRAGEKQIVVVGDVVARDSTVSGKPGNRRSHREGGSDPEHIGKGQRLDACNRIGAVGPTVADVFDGIRVRSHLGDLVGGPGCGEDGRVVSRRSVQGIVARSADDHIIAAAAVQRVVPSIADQCVVCPRPRERIAKGGSQRLLDAAEGIRTAKTVAAAAGQETDAHSAIGGGVIEHIVARAAGNAVIARAAGENVVQMRAGDDGVARVEPYRMRDGVLDRLVRLDQTESGRVIEPRVEPAGDGIVHVGCGILEQVEDVRLVERAIGLQHERRNRRGVRCSRRGAVEIGLAVGV